MDYEKLMQIAHQALNNSYSPYSGIKVGVALLAKSGKVYTGTNIENQAYSVTCCAERVALFKAVSEGERGFDMIAICGYKDGALMPICSPCGSCRQALSEFVDGDFKFVLGNVKKFFIYTLNDILPIAFNSGLRGEDNENV